MNQWFIKESYQMVTYTFGYNQVGRAYAIQTGVVMFNDLDNSRHEFSDYAAAEKYARRFIRNNPYYQ